MTINEFGAALAERALVARWQAYWVTFVVWLFPPDDPAQLIVTEGVDLEVACRKALDKWDKAPDEGPN